MGGFTPTIAMAALQTGLQLVQAKQQARAGNAAAASAAQFQRQQAEQAQAIRERDRRERLRRVLASQRARFGAHGIGGGIGTGVGAGGGGSAEAVLTGLANDTERAIADERERLGLSFQALERDLAERRRRNLLELSNARRRLAFGALETGLGGFTSLLEP